MEHQRFSDCHPVKRFQKNPSTLPFYLFDVALSFNIINNTYLSNLLPSVPLCCTVTKQPQLGANDILCICTVSYGGGSFLVSGQCAVQVKMFVTFWNDIKSLIKLLVIIDY